MPAKRFRRKYARRGRRAPRRGRRPVRRYSRARRSTRRRRSLFKIPAVALGKFVHKSNVVVNSEDTRIQYASQPTTPAAAPLNNSHFDYTLQRFCLNDPSDPKLQYLSTRGLGDQGDPIPLGWQHASQCYRKYQVIGAAYKLFMKIYPPDTAAAKTGDTSPIHVFSWVGDPAHTVATESGVIKDLEDGANDIANWMGLATPQTDTEWNKQYAHTPVDFVRFLSQRLKHYPNFKHQQVMLENYGQVSAPTFVIKGYTTPRKIIKRLQPRATDILDAKNLGGVFGSIRAPLGTNISAVAPDAASRIYLNVLCVSLNGTVTANGHKWRLQCGENIKYFVKLYEKHYNQGPGGITELGSIHPEQTADDAMDQGIAV